MSGYQIQTSDMSPVPTTSALSLCKSGSLMISVGGRRPIVVSDQVSELGPCTSPAFSPKISLLMFR